MIILYKKKSRLVITTVILLLVIYFSYFHHVKHEKDINKPRILDYYGIRVDMSIKELEDKFGTPYQIISDYDFVKESLWEQIPLYSFSIVDKKSCTTIFKGEDRMNAFYSYDNNVEDVKAHLYRYYGSYNNESYIIVYMKDNQVVGVDCE